MTKIPPEIAFIRAVAAAASPVQSTSVVPTSESFPQFSRFHIELRNHIWFLAGCSTPPPRLVGLIPKKQGNLLPIPILSQVCSESRELCKRRCKDYYELISTSDVEPYTVLINYGVDILFLNNSAPFSSNLVSQIMPAKESLSPQRQNITSINFSRVQRLALSIIPASFVGGALETDDANMYLGLEESFPNLRELRLIVNNSKGEKDLPHVVEFQKDLGQGWTWVDDDLYGLGCFSGDEVLNQRRRFLDLKLAFTMRFMSFVDEDEDFEEWAEF